MMQRLWKDRSLVNIGPQLKGYPENELEVIPSIDLQKIQSASVRKLDEPYQPDKAVELGGNAFALLDLGTNLTGFIGACVECSRPTKLYVTFDEILTKDDVDFKRLGCVNAVGYELQPGTYRLDSFEPYAMRYLKLNVLEGACRVRGVYLREYANAETGEAAFSCSDPRLNRIFQAARQTFRQNAVDIFMDCPSRERAGWLCDSFFTSRVAFDLCGNTTIEKNFFENYLLPPGFAHLPDGMLPMCYPADHYDGIYIPNWALWFVIELEEYQARSGDCESVSALRPRLEALYQYFQKYRNEDGLLEKLDSWVFIEWSRANEFVRDVSYATNMLYAAALAAGGRMYNEPDLIDEAERLRDTIRRQSFDGQFFVDNAIRKDGKLQVTRNHTEVCQYFAFFFDVATPQMHGELWKKLVNDFGPGRSETKAFPEIHPANAFVGNCLRSELLSRYGRQAQIEKELVDYYLYMADQTGMLWENVGAYASCDRGCAGLSLGGKMAMWLGAMDERIAAEVSAGFLTTMDAMEQNHCMCWKFDGLRELVDYADIYSLTAPRPLECQNGLLEPLSQFYVPRARQAMEEVRLIYCDMDRPEDVALDVHAEGHVIDLPALMYFFEKYLRTGGQ